MKNDAYLGEMSGGKLVEEKSQLKDYHWRMKVIVKQTKNTVCSNSQLFNFVKCRFHFIDVNASDKKKGKENLLICCF